MTQEQTPAQISASEKAKREGRFTRALFVGGDTGHVSLLDAEHAPAEVYTKERYADWVIEQRNIMYGLGNWIDLPQIRTCDWMSLKEQLGIQVSDKIIDGLYGTVYLLTEEQYQTLLAKEAALAREKEDKRNEARRKVEEKKAAFFAPFKTPLANPTISELRSRAFVLKGYNTMCNDPKEDCNADEVYYLEFPFREDAENFAKLTLRGTGNDIDKVMDKVVIVRQHTY